MSNNPTRYIKSIAHQPVDPGIHGQIVDSMSATTDKRGNAPSIRMAMSNGLPAGAIVEYTGNEVPDGYRRRDDIPTLSELNDNLAQTPITVGGETLSTINEKLNFLCEKQQYLGVASKIYDERVVSHTYTITQGDVDYYKALIFINYRIHTSVNSVPTITGADYTFDLSDNAQYGVKIGIVTDLEVGKTISMSYNGNPGQIYRCTVIGIN